MVAMANHNHSTSQLNYGFSWFMEFTRSRKLINHSSHSLTSTYAPIPSQGEILTDDDTVFELAAWAMQAEYGNYQG